MTIDMKPNRNLALTVFALCGIAPCLYAASKLQDRRIISNVIVSSIVSLAGFWLTKRIIPVLKPAMLRANLFGYDINKKGQQSTLSPHPFVASAYCHVKNVTHSSARLSTLTLRTLSLASLMLQQGVSDRILLCGAHSLFTAQPQVFSCRHKRGREEDS